METEAERVLWQNVRSRKLLGFKFRRQFPIENFILDFYCIEAKLAVELDGSGHMRSKQKEYDLARTKKLK